MIGVHQNLTVLSKLVFARKFHKLPHFTRDVTGQHYRPVPSDVSLPRLSERRRRLKFRLLKVSKKKETIVSSQNVFYPHIIMK